MARRKTTQLPETNDNQEVTEQKAPSYRRGSVKRVDSLAFPEDARCEGARGGEPIFRFGSVTTPGFGPEMLSYVPTRALCVKKFFLIIGESLNPPDWLLRLLSGRAHLPSAFG